MLMTVGAHTGSGMRLSVLCLFAVSAGVCLSWSATDLPLHAATIEIYYAPEDLPGDKLVAIYERARRYIYVSIYGITYPPVVKALVSAKKRGVDVRVITDREKLNDPKQVAALETLRLAGIPIRVNQHDGLMHLKQVVVDDEVNTSGSMNQTTSGHRYNDERLDVITDPITSAKARDKFLTMWKDPVRYAAWR
jgi:phosphatidylserine/phosphatidylglycerophosphate/cardiolipin synthase-like enzyme